MCVLGYRYDGVKRTTFGSSFWNNEEQAKNSLSRRDVPTSRRRVNQAEVNDVTTSRRHHVVTSPRRDVSLQICISSFNARRLGKGGIGKRMNGGTDFQSQRIQTSRECPGFVPLSIFVIYYLGYDDDVFDTRYSVLFIHDVLDLFLGLHQTLSRTMD